VTNAASSPSRQVRLEMLGALDVGGNSFGCLFNAPRPKEQPPARRRPRHWRGRLRSCAAY
jgi:hypothetical protein